MQTLYIFGITYFQLTQTKPHELESKTQSKSLTTDWTQFRLLFICQLQPKWVSMNRDRGESSRALHALKILNLAFAKVQTVAHQFIKCYEPDIHKTCFPQLAFGISSDVINHYCIFYNWFRGCMWSCIKVVAKDTADEIRPCLIMNIILFEWPAADHHYVINFTFSSFTVSLWSKSAF